MVDGQGQQPRLQQQVRAVIRTRRYSLRTEKVYWYWIRYFIRFHDMTHPLEMGEKEVRQFLTWLATQRNVAAATQNQALNALVFLYAKVLNQPLGDIGNAARAKGPSRLPVVLTDSEARRVIAGLEAPYDLMASLMYGAGLWVPRCARGWIKDRDSSRRVFAWQGARLGSIAAPSRIQSGL
ncbi:phage integrase N-terminal SAM-like domain-containing protein [Algiphilus sp.]|uniref:phage integrase N-terminal SAM-like domain-containing protein n=1 Tax=Algiphilus sp. TaxID=1872431 RepID=UPI0025BBECEA|nr:phage integrase N-terminal SAM-like domain-containing protein [Algiphilus sp.]MCK5771641.1 phage integrase N-terminal SAM-like domain-containing protein [Algiphilus sp.]